MCDSVVGSSFALVVLHHFLRLCHRGVHVVDVVLNFSMRKDTFDASEFGVETLMTVDGV